MNLSRRIRIQPLRRNTISRPIASEAIALSAMK